MANAGIIWVTPELLLEALKLPLDHRIEDVVMDRERNPPQLRVIISGSLMPKVVEGAPIPGVDLDLEERLAKVKT